MGTWHQSKTNVEILKKIESIKDDVQMFASDDIAQKIEKIDEIQNIRLEKLTDSLKDLARSSDDISMSLMFTKNSVKSQQEQLVLIFKEMAELEAHFDKKTKMLVYALLVALCFCASCTFISVVYLLKI
jgi:uncharacterized protein YoxC